MDGLTADEATRLLKALAENVADWQRAASAGRGTKSASAKARKAAEALFESLTGERPTGDQVEVILRTVGMV